MKWPDTITVPGQFQKSLLLFAYPFAGFAVGAGLGASGTTAAAVPLAWQAGLGTHEGLDVHFAWHSFISFFDIFLPSQAAIASGEQEAKTAVPGSKVAALLLLSAAPAFVQQEGDGVQAGLADWATTLDIASPQIINKTIITLFIGNQFVSE